MVLVPIVECKVKAIIKSSAFNLAGDIVKAYLFDASLLPTKKRFSRDKTFIAEDTAISLCHSMMISWQDRLDTTVHLVHVSERILTYSLSFMRRCRY